MNTGTNYIHLVARLRAEAATAAEYEEELIVQSPRPLSALFRDAADALEAALPAITSWNSPDALRTRISMLTQNPYSPHDSVDSPQPTGDQ